MTSFTSSGAMRPIEAAIKTVPLPSRPHATAAETLPFITVSRECGAGGWNLANRLARRLTERDHLPDAQGWRCYDREIVERAVSHLHLPQRDIDEVEERRRNWIADFFGGIASEPRIEADDLAMYHRIAAHIRRLAGFGRAIVVGRGGFCVTRDMPGGIHLRLVAPLNFRIQNLGRLKGMTADQATREVRMLDEARRAFYKRYLNAPGLTPDMFTMTLNTAAISEEQMVQCIEPLVVVQHAAAG